MEEAVIFNQFLKIKCYISKIENGNPKELRKQKEANNQKPNHDALCYKTPMHLG